MPPEFDRTAMLARLADETFDLVVVGGGVTGAGAALDAASRGLGVALVEKDDLASGTSSKSSKLVHGGLRYLQNGELALVKEALRERQRLLDNAPHLVRPLPFVIPVFGGGAIPPGLAKALGSALWAYDRAGGSRIGRTYERLDPSQVVERLPVLSEGQVGGGYLYWDAQADDARLVLTIARTAAAHGAVVATRAPLRALRHDGAGRVRAVVVESGRGEIEIRTRAVVNAGGVWADEVRAADEGTNPGALRPAKGIHLTFRSERLPVRAAVIVTAADKRSLFAVPWEGGFTYVGTTDTDFDGSLDEPYCTPEDVAYVLAAINRFTAAGLTESDVIGTWGGLRPLVRDAASARTADLSRRHQVRVADSGMVTVAGGKLTTYRPMAADAVDAVVSLLGLKARSRTAKLRLLNATDERPADGDQLARRFGTEAPLLRALVAERPGLGEPLVPGLPYLAVEAVWAARYEQAITLADVLERRTRARLLDLHATVAAAPAVAALLAPELSWDADEQARQVAAFRHSAAREWAAAGLPDPSGVSR